MSNTMLEALKKHMEDPKNVEEMHEYFNGRHQRKEDNILRIANSIKGLSKSEIQIKFEQFLKWEEETEEYNYTTLHKHMCSNIFNAILSYVELNGEIINDEFEDFKAASISMYGYIFKLYNGQGSFWRIMKNGENIFQTT